MITRDTGKITQKRTLFVGRRIAPGDLAETAARLGVGLDERHHNFIDRPGQRHRQAREGGSAFLRRGLIRNHDRIESPDHGARSEPVAQRPDMGHRLVGRRHRPLDAARQAGDGKLDHEGQARLLDRVEAGKEGPGILGPENHPFDLLGVERNPARRATIGIGHDGKSGPQPAEQPGAIVGRNICPVGGRNDH
jgi:hypothetical protein